METLNDIRVLIRSYDIIINDILNGDKIIVATDSIMEFDEDISRICKNKPNEESLIMIINKRLSLSSIVAEIKFKKNPHHYLFLCNDFLKLVTNPEVELEITRQFPDSIFLKIMEISKKIQVNHLEKKINNIKIGYLYDKEFFPYEVIKSNLRGNHVCYPNYDSLNMALNNHEIDFMIIQSIYIIEGNYTEFMMSLKHNDIFFLYKLYFH